MTWSVLIAATALGLALAGCGGDAHPASEVSGAATSPARSPGGIDSDAPAGAGSAAGAACGQQQTGPHAELVGQLPAGFPTVAGWRPTKVTNQGLTREVSGVLRGGAGDLVTVRDTAADELVSAGYDRTGADEEPGYEAEAEFEGPHEVNIKVKPLCRDYLVLRYTVRQ